MEDKRQQELMDASAVEQALRAMADRIREWCPNANEAALIGIRTRGAVMAHRLQQMLSETGWTAPLGILDITLYRDDLSQLASNPQVQRTHLEFDVNNRMIFLIDDVLYTGRTIRAALSEIVDFGRPKAVRLMALVDRGGHELPIRADFASLTIDVAPADVVKVGLRETDGDDRVVLAPRSPVG